MKIELNVNKQLILESALDAMNDMDFGSHSDTPDVKINVDKEATTVTGPGSTVKGIEDKLGKDFHKDPTKLTQAKDLGAKELGLSDKTTATTTGTDVKTEVAPKEKSFLDKGRDMVNSLSTTQKVAGIGAATAAGIGAGHLAARKK